MEGPDDFDDLALEDLDIETLEKLDGIKADCDKSVEYRILAGESGAYKAILDTLENRKDDKEIVKACLRTLLSLMTKQPDLLDDRGLTVILSHLKNRCRCGVKKVGTEMG
ncbi:hypothetical protein NQ317_000902 [Molorchus minor]|uniref:Uncharacterized protein n=1 Tax=Molorchus minor TaxID=1323400 RepID=A0ABQ9JMQ8_9CUCU|nr:hypothetical protein NQ317_000902 [Molorchus minor]